jgi:hypothetical protein
MNPRKELEVSRLAVLCVAAGLAGSCAPAIYSFHAEPNVTCEGTPALLVWDASTDGELSATPPDPKVGKVDAKGTKPVSPKVKTQYLLTVKRIFRKPQQKPVDVDVIPTGQTREISGPLKTCAAPDVQATIVPASSDWDGRLLAGRVKLGLGVERTYHVEHLDTEADVGPGEGTAAFAALPVQGTWTISTKLAANEACGDAPNNFVLAIVPTCSP